MDLLDRIDRVRASISLGESHFREFKSAFHGVAGGKSPRKLPDINADIAETLVAFGNADGGELIIGVEDDGSITGIPHDPAAVEVMLAAPRNGVMVENPLIVTNADVLDLDGQRVIHFSVAKGHRGPHVTTSGKCLRRNDRMSIPTHPQIVELDEQERRSRLYEREFLDGLHSSDLDFPLIEKACRDADLDFSPEKYLQYTQLAEFDRDTLRLRRAAGLLFAKNISAVHPRCQVRIVRALGSAFHTGERYEVAEDSVESDNILRLIPRVWERLRKHLARDKFVGEGRFRTTVLYPEFACLESLVNAIAHRDYSIEGRGVEILIYDDSMAVTSPGALLTTVSLKDLIARSGVHESRNPLIARVLRDSGHMRELGEGIRRIFDLMHEADRVDPRIETDHQSFRITLENRTIFTPEDLAWLSEYEAFGLSREERLVMLLGRNGKELSQQDIFDGLGLTDLADYQQLTTELTINGLLIRTRTQQAMTNLLKGKGRYKHRRDIPRFVVRTSEETRLMLADLRQAIIGAGEFDMADSVTTQAIRDRLPEGHFYKKQPGLGRILGRLNYLDATGRPTEKLRGLWEAGKDRPPLARSSEPLALVGSVGTEQPQKADPARPKPRPVVLPETELERRQEKTTAPLTTNQTPTATGPVARRSRPATASPSAGSRPLFVRNISAETTVADLYAVFSRAGCVSRAVIFKPKQVGALSRTGLIHMNSSEEACVAIEQLNGTQLHGRQLLITWARELGPRQ